MGMYSSHSFNSYEIPKKLHDYLLPIYGICAPKQKSHVSQRNDIFYFVGSKYHYSEMLERSEFFRTDENIILIN